MFSRIISLLTAILLGTSFLGANPVITEFMASNVSSVTDQDGDHSDWIEIHNPTSSPIDLEGWHLTDKPDAPNAWTFPSVVLQPDGYLIVFASNKNRAVSGQELHTNFALSAGGEYLGLIAPDAATVGTEFAPSYPPQIADISYGFGTQTKWINLLEQGSPLRFHVPVDGSLADLWRQQSFDDSSWAPGTLGIGFDRNTSPVNFNPFIGTNVESGIFGLRNSVYIRVPFTVGQPLDIFELELRTRYDDGFAAFLNGSAQRLDEMNAPTALSWDSAATAIVYDEDGIVEKVTDLSHRIGGLVAGTNTLAVHGLNANTGSSDLLIAPVLRARVPDESASPDPGFFTQVTPGARNAGYEGQLLQETVVFSRSSGTFTGTIGITMTGANAGQTIRYTTNGSVPTADSSAYTGQINLNSTRLLRARIFDANGRSGLTSTVHYQRLSSALANRKSNLPMVIMDARGATLNDTTRQPAYFQLFGKDQSGVSSLAATPEIVTRQGIRFRGSSSQSQPKKPYSVEFWDESDNSRDLAVLGMSAEADWVFYAPYNYDRVFTRNSVIYELSRRIDRWAPNTRFVEVFYNGNGGDLVESDYVGVYAIIEQVKLNSTRIGHSTINPSDVPPSGPINPLGQGSWTGGYLFKIDRSDADEYNWHTSRNIPTATSGTNNSIVLNRPKLPDLDGGPYLSDSQALAGSRQIAYIRSYVQSFEDALYADRSANFTTRNHLNYIDRDAWIDHLILAAFSKNVDALRLSAFFHKIRDGKIVAGPAWDFDRSMNSRDERDDVATTWYGTGTGSTRYFEYDWWGALCADPDFEQKFYDRWAELRQTVFSNQNLSELILSMRDEINNSANGLGSAAVRDAARWSSNSPSGSYTNETQNMLDWIITRSNWMDRRRIDSGLLPQAPVIVANGDEISIGGGSAIYYTLTGEDPRSSGGAANGIAYSGVFSRGSATKVTARSLENGLWSTPAVLLFDPPVTNPVFLPTGTGDWASNANWSTTPAPYPDMAGASVTVPPPASGSRNVDIGTPVTVGEIHFPQGASTGRNRIRGGSAGNSFTFNNGNDSSKLRVSGTGAGFVEFEIVAGVVLQSTLEIDITNIAGDPEYGALRLREGWSGSGGLTKRGAGVASLTGEGKLYSGATRIEEGVLSVTGPSNMTNSSSVTVLDGGQLRLVSASSPGAPRIYTFGGDLFLSGSGRGAEIPESEGLGRLGALRYDPGSNGNTAVLTNPVEFPALADIHVDGTTNSLEITGAIRGSGGMRKTGGGKLAITGHNPGYAAPVLVDNGTLMLRGSLASSVTLGDLATLDVAGVTGSLSGTGSLILPGTTVTTPRISGLAHSLVFFREGAPAPSVSSDSGNPLIITGDPGMPLSLDFYLDLPGALSETTRIQGGHFMPSGTPWAPLLDGAPKRVFIADASGNHTFNGKTWTLNTGASFTSVPTALDIPGGLVEGRILEIRFDGRALTYDAWRDGNFTPSEALDPEVSGPYSKPYGDGISNILRYALGIEPGSNPQDKLPRFSMAGETASFSFPYDPALRGIRWIVESSVDLVSWHEADILFDSSADLVLPDAEGRLVIESAADEPSRFYRLRIAEDPTR